MLVSLIIFLLHFRYVPMKKITCIKGISEQKVHTVLPPSLRVSGLEFSLVVFSGTLRRHCLTSTHDGALVLVR